MFQLSGGVVNRFRVPDMSTSGISFAFYDKIDKWVEEAFDEYNEDIFRSFTSEINEALKSERRRRFIASKIIKLNKNHVYCLRCNEHFYSSSVLSDIMSCFQNHINTNYHKVSTLINPLPKTMPILTWEIFGFTGYCHVCKISGINALIVDCKEFDSSNRFHECRILDNLRFQPQYKYKEMILRFCSLSVVIKKFLIYYNNKVTCCLCDKILEDSHFKLKHHFMSENHYNKFLGFLNEILGLTFADLLNGFNLEIVLRWVFLTYQNPLKWSRKTPKVESGESDCLYESHRLLKWCKGIQYFPIDIKALLQVNPHDFVSNNVCLVCSKIGDFNHVYLTHMTHVQHSFSVLKRFPENFEKYLSNVKERLKPYTMEINHYKNFIKHCNSAKNGKCGEPHSKAATTHKILPEINTISQSCQKPENKLLSTFKQGLLTVISSFEEEIIEKVRCKNNFIRPNTSETGMCCSFKSLPIGDIALGRSNTFSDEPPKQRGKPKNNSEITSTDTNINALTNPKTTNSVVAQQKRNNQTSNQQEGIVIIKNCPDSLKSQLSVLKEKCVALGQIKDITVQNDEVILTFQKLKRAKAAAKKDFFIGDHKLEMVFSTRDVVTKKEPQLHNEIHQYLSNYDSLLLFCSHHEDGVLNKFQMAIERRKEERVLNDLYEALNFVYEKCCFYVFGSRATGLAAPGSDIDIFFDCGSQDGNEIVYYNQVKRTTNAIAKCLGCRKNTFDHVIGLSRTRTPIVKFVHLKTGLSCDLSFRNGLSIENTSLLKKMFSLHKRVRPLIIFLKNWVIKNKFHGRPKFSSYALSLMVIFFLQQSPHRILPSVEHLQIHHQGPRRTVAGWDCSHNAPVSESSNETPFPDLLLGFFEFYANFDYKIHAISPLTGKPLLRTSFNEIKALPMAYKRHLHNIEVGGFFRGMEDVIWVIDPYDIGFNTTGGFPLNQFKSFLKQCELSALLLRAHKDKKKSVKGKKVSK